MRINLAHLRERAASGGWVNFAVFDARSSSGSRDDNARLLAQLTAQARASNLRVEQSALAFNSGGRLQFFGSPTGGVTLGLQELVGLSAEPGDGSRV